jgi:hypothetical protein
MKQTEEQYAESLIKEYCGYLNYSNKMYSMATKIAIQDVTNTIKALGKSSYNLKRSIYYQTVLKILESKK